MASILRVRAQWSGFQGAPGYNLFHFGTFPYAMPDVAAAQACVDKTRSFFFNIKEFLPSQVTVNILADVDVLDPNNAELQAVLGTTAPAVVTGTALSTASYASPVGAVVSWGTGTIRRGRRIRGRSFLVPLSSTAFETNGTLLAGTVTNINLQATAFRTAASGPSLGVYGRPSGPGATDGVFGPATSNKVPDMGAVLRSRRD